MAKCSGKYEYDDTNRVLKFNATDDTKNQVFTNGTLPEGKLGAQIIALTSDCERSQRRDYTLGKQSKVIRVNSFYTSK
jgi:hypothetical protein